MREAKRMFHLCFVNGTLNEDRARQAVQIILKSRRRGYLLLLGYFQRLVKNNRIQHTAKVESAVSVPMDLQEKIRDKLMRTHGPEIHTVFSLNPTLIGGMRIQVGSDVYDGSVESGLEALQRSFGIQQHE
jgi:F-type H+-transporting ATPase subunit delta